MKLVPGDSPLGLEDTERPSDLQQVVAALQSLQLDSANTTTGTEAFTTLAARSKANPEVRTYLATPDILRTLVEAVECSLNDSLETAALALRCIGNACIDNDAARTTITGFGFSWALLCLRNDDSDIRWLTVKVLYNICSNHETAQQHCYHDRVYYPLIGICASPLALHSKDKGTLIDLLFWITDHKASLRAGDLRPMPDDTLLELLSLPYYHFKTAVLEDFATLVDICLTFLRDPPIQAQVITSRRVAYVWQIFEDCENRVHDRRIGDDENEARELLKPLSTGLMWCLSDIAANEAFAQQYSLDDAFMEGLLSIIASGGEEMGITRAEVFEQDGLGGKLFREARTTRDVDADLDHGRLGERHVAAVCQIVGNLLRLTPPADVAALVMERAIHENLWKLLLSREESDDDDVPHSLAGFLVQLTRPSVEVRERMAEGTGAEEALSDLCRNGTPQTKQAGVRLLRALGRDCPVNQRRFEALAAGVVVGGGGGGDRDMDVDVD